MINADRQRPEPDLEAAHDVLEAFNAEAILEADEGQPADEPESPADDAEVQAPG